MRAVARLLLCGVAVAAIFAADPSWARKRTVFAAIEDAVDSFVESRGSVTLPAQGTVEVAFSPRGGCTEATVRFIGEAKASILMAAYGLTSNPIGKALLEAKKRGIDVRVVVDKEHNGRRDNANSIASFLAANGIPVRIDTTVKIQHNKVIIVDGKSVQNGSFNFTMAAQTSNAENIIIHRNFPDLAKAFTDNWAQLWGKSKDYRASY